MSTSFNNFLKILDNQNGVPVSMRDAQHASRLFLQNNYARAPKLGFNYFVSFNLESTLFQNSVYGLDQAWYNTVGKEVGLLVKRTDTPKFTIKTETLNQYNRKTVVQTGLTYQAVNIEFHDDNTDITRDLWQNYYRYHYADTRYGSSGAKIPPAYGDTKYGSIDYHYGLNNSQTLRFFKSIDIFILHQGNYSQYTLINPMITDWTHDGLDASVDGKILSNRMTVSYENVFYNNGNIKSSNEANEFTNTFYDKYTSPLTVNSDNQQQYIVNTPQQIFNQVPTRPSVLKQALTALTQTVVLGQSLNMLTKGNSNVGYSIAAGVVGLSMFNNNRNNNTGLVINPNADQNSSINGETKGVPVSITGNSK